MTVELTQAPGSSSCPTMENSTDSMSDNRCDKDNPLKQVLQLCSTLAGKGCEFSISVRIKDSFAFSLKSGKSETHQGKKRSPSFYRRQERRKLLKKKNADTSLEQPLEEDLLRKRSEQSPAEKAEGHHQEEEATVDTPLNLCPKPVHTRISAGSVDTEDDFDEIQQWAAGGTVTEKSVSASPRDLCPKAEYPGEEESVDSKSDDERGQRKQERFDVIVAKANCGSKWTLRELREHAMIGRSWRFLKILEPMLPTLEDGGLKCNKRLKDCDSTFSVEYDHYEDS